jgi:hypothetical protein
MCHFSSFIIFLTHLLHIPMYAYIYGHHQNPFQGQAASFLVKITKKLLRSLHICHLRQFLLISLEY